MDVVKKIWTLSKNTLVKILSERFKKIFENNNPKTKLVSYFVGCYPTPDQSFELIKEAIDNGVSILEIGYCTSEASAVHDSGRATCIMPRGSFFGPSRVCP